MRAGFLSSMNVIALPSVEEDHLSIPGWTHHMPLTASSKGSETSDPSRAPRINCSFFAPQRTECKDYVSLIVCEKWRPLVHVQLLTQDAQDLCFSPNSSCLCVWDSLDYNIFIHALDGSCLASYRAYSEPALGIRIARWGPSGQLLALGGFDNVCPDPSFIPSCIALAMEFYVCTCTWGSTIA